MSASLFVVNVVAFDVLLIQLQWSDWLCQLSLDMWTTDQHALLLAEVDRGERGHVFCPYTRKVFRWPPKVLIFGLKGSSVGWFNRRQYEDWNYVVTHHNLNIKLPVEYLGRCNEFAFNGCFFASAFELWVWLSLSASNHKPKLHHLRQAKGKGPQSKMGRGSGFLPQIQRSVPQLQIVV